MAVAGVYRGRVTRVTDGQVWAEVPRLVRHAELGPLPVAVDAGAGRALIAGDGVLLGLVEGRPDDLIVIARTEGIATPPTPGPATELDPALYAATAAAVDLDAAGAGGAALTVARGDHRHELLADPPGTIAPDDTAAEGVAEAVARADHRHAITAAAPGAVTLGDTAAEGGATSFARSDHRHAAPDAATIAAAANPPGILAPYAGAAAPAGWLLCDGASYPTATYPGLFTAIGYAYGGSGANFNVPNVKGRVLVGLDAADADWDTLGETRGAKTHTLAEAEMPVHTHDQSSHNHTQSSHNHTQNAHNHTQNAHNHGINTAATAMSNPANSLFMGAGNPPTADGGDVVSATATNIAQTATNIAATAVNLDAGGGGTHNNLQPSLVVNYIIRT